MLARRIVFYAVEDLDPETPFDIEAALDPINDLEERVWVVSDHGLLMAVIVDEIGEGDEPSCFRFLRIRDDRPYIIGPDREPELVEIEQDYRVTDFTYAMLWPDGFLGAISSRDAPVIKYLSTYFSKTTRQRCRIENIYASDVVQRFKKLKKRLTKATVKIGTAEAEQMEADEELKGFKAFFVAGRESEAVTVNVELSVDRKRDRFLHKSVAAGVGRLATYGDLVDALVIVGEDAQGRRQELDMKRQRIFRRVLYEQTDTNDMMYARIASARREVEDPDEGGKPLNRAAKMSSLA
ncbi:hypothetical protein [Conexibacter sp. CPCC 206217]|uniref:hypothetical protein n=1 Tax=Conexibacter sp. CPCC 206217 TaxID=3064574 RepID=UPI00271A0C4A|nr:hypothetical protein [Conexibacter sp. CPCC 206217]MDO8211011.1 hypothetical protein [Conexibacter sp. CPCC 206217]